MDLSFIRQNFAPAEFDKKICEDCQHRLSGVNLSHDPVFLAYKAAFRMISANFIFSPFEKLTAFQQGRDQIETLVAHYPSNLELRYIRLALQMRSPIFLGYKSSIDADKRFISKNLSLERDIELVGLIVDFVNTQTGIETSYRIEIQKIAQFSKP